jgi:RNA polymerase sigma-70 factor, ECF subfamily
MGEIGINPATRHRTVVNFDYEQIVSNHYESLYRFAFSLAQNENDASDLAQDTFYTLAAKGHQLRDKSKVKTWLFTTLHRKFLGARRHNTRFPHCEISDAGDALPTISSKVVDEMDGAIVWESLMMLEDIYRTPLVLFYLDDQSYEEIAEALEVPIGTVMSRISRGKGLLRQRLAKPETISRIVPFDQKQRKSSPHD